MSAVDIRPLHSRLPARWMVGLVVVVASLVVVGVLMMTAGGPARGLDATCGDFVQMTDDEQTEVIRESGRWKRDSSAGIDYYLEVCSQGDGDDQLKYFEG